MKYTAKVECFATGYPSYTKTIILEAKDDQELDFLLDKYANANPHASITTDDSLKPTGFGYSGGFYEKLISFFDENERDVIHLNRGAI